MYNSIFVVENKLFMALLCSHAAVKTPLYQTRLALLQNIKACFCTNSYLIRFLGSMTCDGSRRKGVRRRLEKRRCKRYSLHRIRSAYSL